MDSAGSRVYGGLTYIGRGAQNNVYFIESTADDVPAVVKVRRADVPRPVIYAKHLRALMLGGSIASPFLTDNELMTIEKRRLEDAYRKGLHVPRVLEDFPDERLPREIAGQPHLVMTHLFGPYYKKGVPQLLPFDEQQNAWNALGAEIGRWHAEGIAHGDTNTANAAYVGGEAYLFDLAMKPFPFLPFSALRRWDITQALCNIVQEGQEPHAKIFLAGYRSSYDDADSVVETVANTSPFGLPLTTALARLEPEKRERNFGFLRRFRAMQATLIDKNPAVETPSETYDSLVRSIGTSR